MNRLSRLLCLPSVCLVMASAPLLHAQSAASLHGQVTDPTGAIVPGAAVQLSGSGRSFTATAGDDGHYAFGSLPAGQYTLDVNVPGFTPFSESGIAIASGASRAMDIALTIATQQQQVEVTADANQIDTEPPDNGNAVVISGKALDSLSDDPDEMQNELTALAGPGAGNGGAQIFVDGFTGGQMPPKSAIREIRINQNPFSAEYDKLGYGRIEILTKPGFGHMHGELEANGNTSAFNTTHFVTNPPSYYEYYLDGSIGGPINKNASWFFSIFTRNTQNLNIVNAQGTPTDPNYYAEHNNTNFIEGVLNPQRRIYLSPRLDLQLSPSNTLTLRYQLNRGNESADGVGQLNLPSQGYNSYFLENTVQVSDSQIINVHLVNDLRFQYERDRDQQVAQDLSPTVTVQGAFTGGGSNEGVSHTHVDHYEFQDEVTGSFKKHTLHMGTRLRAAREADASNAGSNGAYIFTDATSFIAGRPSLGTVTRINNPEAKVTLFDAALYIQDDWKITPKLTVNLGLRWDYFSPFHEVQDRWSYLDPTITNPATGNLGALQFAGNRGEGISCNCSTPVHAYFKNIGPRLGFAYSVDDKTVIRGGFAIAYSRAGGVGGRAGAGTGTGQLGLTGVTATAPPEVATGAGAGPSFYLNNSADFTALGMANTDWGGPGYTAPSIAAPNTGSLILNTGNYLNGSGKFVTAGAAPGYADPYLSGRAPQVVFYNAGVQRSITNDLTIAVNYAGSQAHFINPSGSNGRGYWSNSLNPVYLAGLGGLSSSTSATAPLLDAPATAANIAKAQAAMPGIQVPYSGVAAAAAANSSLTISQMLRAFPQYSSVSDLWGANIANISYNSLQISLVQRAWRGLSYTLNYTYSHNVGDDGTFRSGFALPAGVVSGSTGSYSQNRIDRAPSTQAVPQSVSAYGVWQLPFGRDHIGADNALVRTLAGGWQMSGIFTYVGGSPVAVTTSGCRSEVGTCVPDLNSDYHGSGRINGSYGSKNTGSDFTTQYLDPNAFAKPQNLFTTANPVYLIGNAARTHAFDLETPGKYNLDMGIKRSIDLGSDRYKFIFEANCLNVTHKHTFTGLNAVWTPGSTTFGRFTGASGNRDWQLAGHITF